MSNKCNHCQEETNNPKYCSKSCAAKENNKVPKRKRKEYYCKNCNIPIKYRRTVCDDCNPLLVDWSRITLGETQGRRKYQQNSRIRNLARRQYNGPKLCYCCGYDKHYEICHIKPISSFELTATIAEINDDSNLIALCPNCHWELDNGLLDLDFSFLAAFTQEFPT